MRRHYGFFGNKQSGHKREVYTTVINYFGGSVYSNTGSKLRLRPHLWSPACTTIHMILCHVKVVINGVLTYNITINSKDSTDNIPTVFANNIVLGI